MSETERQRVALITGAAGGLGGSITQALQRAGWQVVGGWHRNAPAQVDGWTAVSLDVTSADGVARVVEGILSGWGRIDLLVNNAGVTVNKTLTQTTEEEWEQVMAVNLRGAFLCSKAVMRSMFKQRCGHIINISSFAARSGPRGQAAYASAKAALIGLTQSIAKEAGSRNVQANAVLPGVLPTSMTEDLPDEVMKAFAQANALGRINDIQEVAGFVAMLAGMKNISGQVFQLDSRIAPWT